MKPNEYELSAYIGQGGWYAKWRTKWTDAVEHGPFDTKREALKAGKEEALQDMRENGGGRG